MAVTDFGEGMDWERAEFTFVRLQRGGDGKTCALQIPLIMLSEISS